MSDGVVRRPTGADVAREAGVSPSTVSRALNGTGYTAPQVRERVRAAAARIGYIPDANARSLRNRSSRSVGVLISDLRNPFYADLAAGIEQVLRAAGYHMILVNDDGSAEEELLAVQTFAAMRVSGVIITPVSSRSVKSLREHGINVVQADRRAGTRHGDAVLGDNEQGAELVTEHLLALGHRRIALLIDETKWTTGAGRLAGYRAAHEAAGVPLDEKLIAFTTSFEAEAARGATAELLDAHPDVTALFAANNVIAQGAFQEIQRRRIAVPRKLSLAAYDDVPWMSMVRPGITTVTQHTVSFGKRCAEVLLSRLDGAAEQEPTIIHVQPELVVRASTAAPR
ncbi:LacI family transcriptional regulator [Allokutzneria sp. A3M-2-11 16]|uniref:LacI family DNA-binding transcriptional regulator n=1 Tax=Allokutzneria sp. A3M-2-11 16 TaxID=2962043 RepID=UPI0020B75761|nr:LacI family DNA-binding transcriptional regulator [Allokutzneria sp. A3M-2-11 16]MCP3803979.1 LacI family transcriptional regulator [Allokutzneria sp. A3M-2-11 16]